MKIYIGDYWIPFPSSEYGGTWAVIAKNDRQVIDLLKELSYDNEYHHKIPDAVENAYALVLHPEYADHTPRVLDHFFT